MTTWRQSLKWGLVVVSCPCHLPWVAGLLAGTAVGGWLASHLLLALVSGSGLFAASLLWAGTGDRVAAAPPRPEAGGASGGPLLPEEASVHE